VIENMEGAQTMETMTKNEKVFQSNIAAYGREYARKELAKEMVRKLKQQYCTSEDVPRDLKEIVNSLYCLPELDLNEEFALFYLDCVQEVRGRKSN
jgi:hypothetical protein